MCSNKVLYNINFYQNLNKIIQVFKNHLNLYIINFLKDYII